MNGAHLALGGAGLLAAVAAVGKRGSANYESYELVQAILRAPNPFSEHWGLEEEYGLGSLYWIPRVETPRLLYSLYGTPFWEDHRGIVAQVLDEDGDGFNMDLFPRWTGALDADVQVYFEAMKPLLNALETLRRRGRLARDLNRLIELQSAYRMTRWRDPLRLGEVREDLLHFMEHRRTKAERRAIGTLMVASTMFTRRVLLGGREVWMMDKHRLTEAEVRELGLP